MLEGTKKLPKRENQGLKQDHARDVRKLMSTEQQRQILLQRKRQARNRSVANT